MTLPETTDVLIVGAGPIGLTAAVVLRQRGHDVTIVDKLEVGASTSRAAVVHARSLELLEPYGVSRDLVGRGLHARRFTIRDRDRTLIGVPFGGLPTAYPYTLMISQADTEAFLRSRLARLGGEVVRPATVTGIRPAPDAVIASFAGGGEIRARYLIGADGMHSLVREQAGIGFPARTDAESFSLADVRLSGGVPDDEVVFYFSSAGMLVVVPLPDGQHRLVAAVDEAPEHPDAAFAQRLLDTRGPRRDRAVVREVLWGSRFRVHHAIADRYREGRVLLAGDAAHTHSPAGGQGMNLGFEDAVFLAEGLSAVLGGAPEEALRDYARTRPPAARKVARLADRLAVVATMSRAWRPARNAVLGLAGKVPAVRRRLAWQLSGLNRR
jgi:2-polyprenyl-6-methoxyphenol hydroxylase-like FAD-dependent oxidoreductase